MTSPPPSEPAPHSTAMPATAYSASRATLWTGVSVLITDTAGHMTSSAVGRHSYRLSERAISLTLRWSRVWVMVATV